MMGKGEKIMKGPGEKKQFIKTNIYILGKPILCLMALSRINISMALPLKKLIKRRKNMRLI